MEKHHSKQKKICNIIIDDNDNDDNDDDDSDNDSNDDDGDNEDDEDEGEGDDDEDEDTSKKYVLDDGIFIHYKKIWVIKDDFESMIKACGFLVCKSHCSVCLTFKNEKVQALPLLLKLIEVRKVPLYVRDNYAFWNFSPRVEYLQFFRGDGEAKYLHSFKGCLLSLEGLKSSMKVVNLAISVDEENIAIDPGFASLSNETQINLHLKAGTNISNLPNLGHKVGNVLIVSGVTTAHKLWMAEVIKKFFVNNVRGEDIRPNHCLILLNYQLDVEFTETLFEKLNKISKKGIDGIAIFLSHPTQSSEEDKEMFHHLTTDDYSWAALGRSTRLSNIQIYDCDADLFKDLANTYQIYLEDDDKHIQREIHNSKDGPCSIM